jgi:hypothetical protein
MKHKTIKYLMHKPMNWWLVDIKTENTETDRSAYFQLHTCSLHEEGFIKCYVPFLL